MHDYFKTTIFFIFFILLYLLFSHFWGGCAPSDLEKYLRMKYPDCRTTVIEKTPYEAKVSIVCPGKEPIIRPYRRN